MSKMSFLEKIDILFKMSKSSYLYLLVILVLILLGTLFSTTNKRTIDRNKKIYIGVSVFILLSMLILYFSSLSKIFDYMMNNFFIMIYFPNLAIYLFALIITNIIVWISIFHFKTSEYIKKLNCIIYIIMNYLLFLILSTIQKKNLDIFQQSSVYGNKKATALIELSSLIFIIWILFLITYKIILIYLKKDYKQKVKKVVVKKKVKKLPENYEPVEVPDWLYGKIPNRIDKTLLLNQKEANIELEKEIEKQKHLTKEYDNLLTIDDYKKIQQLLKQNRTTITIGTEQKQEKPLKPVIITQQEDAYREKQKQEIIRLEEERKESLRKEIERLEKTKQELEDKQLENNMTELERLYMGIR